MRSVTAGLLFLLAVVVVVVAGAAPSASEFKQTPVAIMPVVADPRGPLLARFAVLVYSLNRNAKLKYVGVSGCDQHPDKGGERYQMVVTTVNPSGATVTYQAVVWGVPKTSQWMLLQFKRME